MVSAMTRPGDAIDTEQGRGGKARAEGFFTLQTVSVRWAVRGGD
jgi:hypothetical protein